MAKRKFRHPLKEGPEEFLMVSGVTVRVRPFPAGLYEKVQTFALNEYPDEKPPQKTIKVLDGTETVDNPEDPGYLATQAEIKKKRDTVLAEAVFDLCVDVVNMEKWEHMIERLERYQGAFPEEPDERQLEFLTSFALSTTADYQQVMASAITQTMIQDPEVVERLNSFRGDLEGAAAPDIETSGLDGNQRLAVRAEAT